MLLIYLDEQALDDAEREQCYRESAQLAHQLNAAGQYRAAAPLEPTSTATSVRVRDGKRVVTDGRFEETKQELASYETSKGTIRFTADKPLPAALVRKLVKARVAQNERKR